MTTSLLSYLTWSLHPSLVKMEVLNNSRINMENVRGELEDIIRFRDEVQGSYDRFLSSLLVSCEDLMVECQVTIGR